MNNTTIKAIVKQTKIPVVLDFRRIYIENEAELRTKLYTWMLAQGYSVTTQMTLTQLINLLVGSVIARFYVIVKTLYAEGTGTSTTNKVFNLSTGASVSGTILNLVGE